MPVYNSGQYLKTAVESILNQSLKEIELILVDDGSTDGSSERCDEYANKDNRVVVIHQKNGGICAARNAALKIARGEYIAFSDHDDEYLPGLLEDNYNKIVSSGMDIIKFGSMEIYYKDGHVLHNEKCVFKTCKLTNQQIKEEFWNLLLVYNCVWDAMFKRSFLVEHSILFNTFFKTGGEDQDFIWHCIGCGATMEISDKVYYKHYLRAGFSTSASYKNYSITTTLKRPEILFPYVKEWLPQLESQRLEYSYFWLQMVLGALCNIISNPLCPLKKTKR